MEMHWQASRGEGSTVVMGCIRGLDTSWSACLLAAVTAPAILRSTSQSCMPLRQFRWQELLAGTLGHPGKTQA